MLLKIHVTEYVDPCSTNPCSNGGTCLSIGASFNCTCAASFVGKTCDEGK